MLLTITRHGQTHQNKAGILQGHVEGTLNEEGILQAKKLAQRLQQQSFCHIYCSDLQRAMHTAQSIALYHKQTPITHTPMLRERYLGEFEGKHKTEVGWDVFPNNNEPLLGESIPALRQRMQTFLQDILHTHQHALVVCHSGSAKMLIELLLQRPIQKLDNTSVSQFNIHPNNHIDIIHLNCIQHLQ
ncbi:MAG: histidine phosphatase family protein [Candidatus Woesearchaeota archaeon]